MYLIASKQRIKHNHNIVGVKLLKPELSTAAKNAILEDRRGQISVKAEIVCL